MNRKPLPWWVTLLTVAAAVVLVLQPAPVHEMGSAGGRLLAPVQLGVVGLLAQIDRVAYTLGTAGRLAAENEAYQQEIQRLKSELVRMGELELENRDLRNLLGLQARMPTGRFLPAKVIGGEANPFVQSIVIDRGVEHGVMRNMSIITWRGLVGRVVEANSTTAKVLLITDANSSVAGRIQDPESRATGLIKGSGGRWLLMQYVPLQERIQTGDAVITSGIGGIYPEGLMLGTVIQVRRKDTDVFQEAYLEPAVEVSKLERLFVLLEPSPGSR